ncbi:MAG: hypothetical protein QOK40_466 [Miltoncostaeaceae bacterium]|jgi:hypothetical protein|nr:hypothetical protein [Miltoncostaeaceae bacterium]
MSAGRALLAVAALLVAGATLTIDITGAPGDAALATAWVSVGLLCLPCMVVWLVRGGRRR